MKYNNLTHKINFIWNENKDNSVNINRINSIDYKNNNNYNVKKICSLETDWEEMNTTAIHDQYDEISRYENWYYKMYEIKIENFPLKFLNYIDYCTICKNVEIPGTNLRSKSDKIVYIHNLNTSDDMLKLKKTITIYINHIVSGLPYGGIIIYQIYSKLILNITNPQSYK